MGAIAVASKDRQTPRWLVVGAIALLGSALVAATLWQVRARKYEPALDSSFFGYRGTLREGNALTYEPGATFRIGFNVTNRGSRAITITGLRWPTVEKDFVAFVSARMYAREGTNVGKLVPVGPVVLAPDETRFFLFRMRFDPCSNTRPVDVAGLADPELSFRFLGVDRSMELDLPGRVRLLVPATCD